MEAQAGAPGAANTCTTKSGSTASPTLPIRSPASHCPVAVRNKISIPATCGAPCRSSPKPLAIRRRRAVCAGHRGGGDDGMSVVDWVLRAYEHDPGIPLPAVLVLGPFMPPAMQRQFRERASFCRASRS